MENNLGTIGIIIPTYKRVDVLREAVESALGQSYRDIEVVVLDDSDDSETAEYLKSLTDRRFTYIVNSENLGLARNINKGVSSLSSEVKWCTVLCDDDYYEKDCIHFLAETALNSNAEAIVHGHIVFVDYEGRYLCDARIPPDEESAFEFVKSRAMFIKDRYVSGVLFSREYFNQIGGYPVFATGMAADDALIFALSLKDRLVYSAESTVYIRIHEDAESQQLVDISGHVEALQEYRLYCKKMAEKSGKGDAIQLSSLNRDLDTHVCEMDWRLWIQSLKKLIRSKVSDNDERVDKLYQLGMDKRFLFPLRARISSFCAFYSGVCPERIGLYRNLWRQIAKLQKTNR